MLYLPNLGGELWAAGIPLAPCQRSPAPTVTAKLHQIPPVHPLHWVGTRGTFAWVAVPRRKENTKKNLPPATHQRGPSKGLRPAQIGYMVPLSPLSVCTLAHWRPPIAALPPIPVPIACTAPPLQHFHLILDLSHFGRLPPACILCRNSCPRPVPLFIVTETSITARLRLFTVYEPDSCLREPTPGVSIGRAHTPPAPCTSCSTDAHGVIAAPTRSSRSILHTSSTAVQRARFRLSLLTSIATRYSRRPTKSPAVAATRRPPHQASSHLQRLPDFFAVLLRHARRMGA